MKKQKKLHTRARKTSRSKVVKTTKNAKRFYRVINYNYQTPYETMKLYELWNAIKKETSLTVKQMENFITNSDCRIVHRAFNEMEQ